MEDGGEREMQEEREEREGVMEDGGEREREIKIVI
jgi:hypothetical protein